MLNWKEIVSRLFVAYGNPKPIELGRRMGIDRGTISKWMSESRNPTIEHLAQTVEDTGVSWDWLLTGEGEMERKENGE